MFLLTPGLSFTTLMEDVARSSDCSFSFCLVVLVRTSSDGRYCDCRQYYETVIKANIKIMSAVLAAPPRGNRKSRTAIKLLDTL